MPRAQELHVVDPNSDENLPLGQAEQLKLPSASEKKPRLQFEHDEALVLELRPATQVVQLTENAVAAFPASHEVQVVAPELTMVRKPAVHSRHASVSDTGAYRPLSHETHSLKLKTYCPAEQESQLKRSAEEYVPLGQGSQSSRES